MTAAFLILTIAMACAWSVQRITGNSGWIDTIWSFSVGAASLVVLWLTPGNDAQRSVVAALILLWSLRLGWHLLKRTVSIKDDPRYAALMAEWGERASLRLFIFLQVQALAGAVLVLTVKLAAEGTVSIVGLLICVPVAVAALLAEAIADAQLAACKRAPPASGICEQGLWAYSRHPNYFFEWLFWASLAAFALASAKDSMALLALSAPVMIYALLRHGSGVPHVEAHMRRTRPQAFEDYARRVPVFFPRLWPR